MGWQEQVEARNQAARAALIKAPPPVGSAEWNRMTAAGASEDDLMLSLGMSTGNMTDQDIANNPILQAYYANNKLGGESSFLGNIMKTVGRAATADPLLTAALIATAGAASAGMFGGSAATTGSVASGLQAPTALSFNPASLTALETLGPSAGGMLSGISGLSGLEAPGALSFSPSSLTDLSTMSESLVSGLQPPVPLSFDPSSLTSIPSISGSPVSGLQPPTPLSFNPSSIAPIAPAAPTGTSGLLSTIANNAKPIGSVLNTVGGLITGQSAQNAVQTNAAAQLEAARVAAEAAKFKPVGVTNNFGSSNFTTDAQGNIVSAGYTLAPWLQKQQEMLKTGSQGSLDRAQQAQFDIASLMTPAATRMVDLGKGYLTASPEAQAQKFMDQQLALLSGSRASSYADMQNRLQQTGRAGLSVGGGGGMMAANPEMQAYYNAQRQQDLQLAANATQGGMDYAKFGVDMTNAGANTAQNMYRTQSAAFDPYKTQMGLMTDNESAGRQNLTDSMNIGNTISQANARAGMILGQGMSSAGNLNQTANTYNPWGTLFGGIGDAMSTWGK